MPVLMFRCLPGGGQVSKCTKIRIDPIAGLSEREKERLLAAGVERERLKVLKEAAISASDARKLAQKGD